MNLEQDFTLSALCWGWRPNEIEMTGLSSELARKVGSSETSIYRLKLTHYRTHPLTTPQPRLYIGSHPSPPRSQPGANPSGEFRCRHRDVTSPSYLPWASPPTTSRTPSPKPNRPKTAASATRSSDSAASPRTSSPAPPNPSTPRSPPWSAATATRPSASPPSTASPPPPSTTTDRKS